MRVSLRLQRFGRKQAPYYRIVAASSSVKRDGRFLEIIGLYHPLAAEDKQYTLNDEKFKHWLSKGAVPSDIVKRLILKTDALREYYLAKINKPKKKKTKEK